MSIRKTLAVSALGIAVSFAFAGSARAEYLCSPVSSTCVGPGIGGGGDTGGHCNGTVDSGCDYCAYNSASVASDEANCTNHYPDYTWTNCTTWVAAECVVG